MLDKNKLDEVMNMALRAHNVIGCRGVTRSDFKFYKNKFFLLYSFFLKYLFFDKSFFKISYNL